MKIFLFLLMIIGSNWITYLLVSGHSSYAPVISTSNQEPFPELVADLVASKVSSLPEIYEEREAPQGSETTLSEIGDFLLNLEESDMRSHLLDVFTSAWFSEDHRALAEWINAQPVSVCLDVPVAVFSGLASEIDPEGSVEWAASVQSPRLREPALRRAVLRYRNFDPHGFRELLDSHSSTARVIRESNFYASFAEASPTEALQRYDIVEDLPEPIERILARRERLAGSSSRVNTVSMDI